jgi:copper transport protein
LLLDNDAVHVWDSKTWNVGAASTRGTALVVATTGLCAVAAGLAVPQATLARLVGWAGVAIVIASFAMSGHAATAEPRWLTVPILLLHVIWIAFWLGSFLPLLAGLDADPTGHAPTVRRFSNIAFHGVPQLLIAGFVLATIQVQSVSSLITTDYGRILLLKIVLVLALLALAAVNRFGLAPLLERGGAAAAGHLKTTIRVEMLLGLLIVSAASFLSQTVPPRAIALQNEIMQQRQRTDRYASVVEAGPRKLLLMLTPARAGWNRLQVRVFDADDAPFEPIEVFVELSHLSAGIEPFRRRMISAGDAYFEYSGPELAIRGVWKLRVQALITDFEQVAFEAEVPVR